MAVELVKDLVKIDETIGKEELQVLVEGEIVVPEEKPKLGKLLNIDGEVQVTETKIVKDKMVVSGLINFKVLYSVEDLEQSVYSTEATADFSEEIDIEGITENALGEVRSNIDHIDYETLDDKKVSVKTVLSIQAKAQADNRINIVKDVKGVNGLQVLKESIKYNDVVGTNNSTTMVKEAFELEEDMPNILDILRAKVKVYERETKVVEDKVIVNGVVDASIMYYGDDKEKDINHLSYKIPFTHFVEINGSQKDMSCDITLHVGNPTCETRDDVNGNSRIIDIESIIKVNAKVYEQKEKEVTVDTYSTKNKFDVKKQAVNINEIIGSTNTKESIKGKLNVSNQDEIIKNIYNINARPILTDYRIIEGKVVIEGLVQSSMLYLGEESNEIKEISEEIPFKTFVDMDGIEENMDCEVDIALEDIKYDKINSREVELEVFVKNKVCVNRIKQINIVTEAQELEEAIDNKKQPSITVYIVQNKDTLWDIAKRFNSTTQEIIETNEIMNPENIMPGEKIIIQKNVKFEI